MRTRCLLTLSLLLGLSLALTVPAAGQQTLVQNGAVVEVNNGGVWDLEGGTMDFGPAGASTRLREERAGRVTGGRLTAIVVDGDVDPRALSTAVDRLDAENVVVDAAGVVGDRLVVVVPRSDGANALRLVEAALAAVPSG